MHQIDYTECSHLLRLLNNQSWIEWAGIVNNRNLWKFSHIVKVFFFVQIVFKPSQRFHFFKFSHSPSQRLKSQKFRTGKCSGSNRKKKLVKVPIWRALKGCNNGFLIFDDLGRKSGIILENYDFCFKSRKSNFFFKSQKSCLDAKESKTIIMRWKPMLRRYFQNIIILSITTYVKKYFS